MYKGEKSGYEEKEPGRRRGLVDYALLYAKGLGMGTADIIPGVSGGTIALLVGIYNELIDSISTAGSRLLLGVFKKGGLRRYLEGIHVKFLAALGIGILTAIYAFSRLLTRLLKTEPVLVWSFFFGLILASIWFVGRQVGRWRWKEILWAGLGGLVGYLISTAALPLSLPDGLFGFFLAGFIAICAMILPGISGSFILLILGKYEGIIKAISELDLSTLIPTGIGAVVGLGCFSHVLSWLLKHHRGTTLACLTGFIAGAIIRTWPWQLVGEAKGISEAVLPGQYEIAGHAPHVAWAVVLILLGMGVVIGLERFNSAKK